MVRPAAPGPFRGSGGGFVLMGGISADQVAGAIFGLWWVSDHCLVSACLLGAWVLLMVGGLVHCRVLEQQAPSLWSSSLCGWGCGGRGCVFCGLLQVAAHGVCGEGGGWCCLRTV